MWSFQVLKVISASPAACSANPKSAMSSPPELTGSAISLVSVVHVQPFVLYCLLDFVSLTCHNVFIIAILIFL